MVGARGFEPPTPCTPCKCATRLRHAPTVVTSLTKTNGSGELSSDGRPAKAAVRMQCATNVAGV